MAFQYAPVRPVTDRILVPPLPSDQWAELRRELHESKRRWVQRPELISFRKRHPWHEFSEQFRQSSVYGFTEQLWRDGWTCSTQYWVEDFRLGDRVGHQVISWIDPTNSYFLIGCDCGQLRLRHWSNWEYLHRAVMTCGCGRKLIAFKQGA